MGRSSSSSNGVSCRLACASLLLIGIMMISAAPPLVNAGPCNIPPSQYRSRCNYVIRQLFPHCMSYLSGAQVRPETKCWDGVKDLINSNRDKPKRQQVCCCLLAGARLHASSFKLGNAKELPSRCGVNIHFTISANVDCSKV